jgi:hypothetical protein
MILKPTFFLAIPVLLFASVGGRIEGTVTDSTGSIVQNAEVTAVNAATGIEQVEKTGKDGSYAFPFETVGQYSIRVIVPGFQTYQRTSITVDANSVLVVNVTLLAGARTDTVNVTDSQEHVETASSQMGEVISARQMTAVPLNAIPI